MNQVLSLEVPLKPMVVHYVKIKFYFFMKNQFLFIVLFLGFSVVSFGQSNPKKFKHIVTVTFTENAPQSEIDAVDKSFKGLSKLKVVKGYEWGVAPITDRNKENKHTYAFTFAKIEDLEVYAKSPEHQKHIKVGAEFTKKVEAVQYFVEK